MFGAIFLSLAGVAAAATTTTYQVLLESRVDAAAPNEVYLASFATLDDVFSQTIGSPTGFTQLAVSPSFQIAGFTHDPGGYRMILESRADAAAPNEVYLASFATLDDVFSQTIGSPTGFTQLAVSPDFKIAGFTYDPGGYRMILESRADAAAPNEVYLASFASLDDVFSQTIGSPTGFTQLAVSPGFEIAGFTYDPGGYRMLLESRADAAAPNEVYLASFASLDDVFSQTIGSPTGFTQLAVSPSFQIADFAATTITTGDVGGSVPEPATWALMLFGFGGLGLAIRRSRHRTALAIA